MGSVAGVDIGGTKIAVGIVGAGGRVEARREYPTEPNRGPEEAFDRIIRTLRELAAESRKAITGIGIGCPGPLDPLTGVIGDVGTLPGWEGASPVARLSEEFGVPVAIENDADAAVIGEAALGAGRGESALIYVTISTGIGAGIMLGGKLFRGAGGAHPEIGHHVIEASGPRCYCGARGCWEALASGPAMAAWAAARGLSPAAGEELTAARVCELARQGNPVAVDAVDREAYYVGVGLANLITMFCPGMVLLSGGVMKSASLLMGRVGEVIRTNCTQVPHQNLRLAMAGLGGDAGLIGAACVWRHRFEQSRERS
jgi:glucokinase